MADRCGGPKPATGVKLKRHEKDRSDAHSHDISRSAKLLADEIANFIYAWNRRSNLDANSRSWRKADIEDFAVTDVAREFIRQFLRNFQNHEERQYVPAKKVPLGLESPQRDLRSIDVVLLQQRCGRKIVLANELVYRVISI